jgi:hypothetical protein
MRIVGLVLVWIVATAIIGIEIAYLAKSKGNAAGFELPKLLEPDLRGWWQVKGVCDTVSGALLIAAIFATGTELWWLVLVLSLIPLVDALVKSRSQERAFGIHGLTAVGMVVAAVLLAPQSDVTRTSSDRFSGV